MFTQNKTSISPEMQRQLLSELYIEKIDDVLAEYAIFFSKHPAAKQDQSLINYYQNLSLLIREIRFGTARYAQQDIDNYLQQAHVAKVKAEVFA